MGRISIRIFNNPDIGGYYHRKAVNILDSVTTSLPTGITITLDGYQITDGDRVLFTNLSDPSLNGRIYEADIVDKKLIFKLARDGRASNGDTLDGDTTYVYFGSHKGELWTYDGGTWIQLDVDILESDDIKRDGSAPPLADISWDGYKLTDLGAPTNPNDAATKAYIDAGISGITEQVQDTVAALIQNGTGLNWTYNDTLNTLTGNVTLSPFNTTDLAEGSNLYYTDERVDDRVSTLIQNGTGLTWTYNDGLGTLQGNVSLSPFSTSDLVEGLNLYYTQARFNIAFAAKSTTDLAEGSNLYYTDERVDDRVAALIIDGPGITWTYNDGAGTLQASSSLAGFDTDDLAEGATNLYFTNERVDDRVAALIQNGTGIQWTYNDGANTLQANVSLSAFSTSDLAEGSNLYYTEERVDDRVSTLIQNGTGLTWTYNDILNTFTGNVSLASFSTTNLAEGSNLYFTDERAQDAVGAALLNSSSLTWSYNDTANQISAVVVASGITHGNLSGLSADDHPQYVLLAGRAGGQTVNGGNAASENLVLTSTSNPTKGEIQLSDSVRIMGTGRNLLWNVDANGNIGAITVNRPNKAYLATGLGIAGGDPDGEDRIKVAGSSSDRQLIVISNSNNAGEAGHKAVNDTAGAVRLVTLGSAHVTSGLLQANEALLMSDSGLANGLIVAASGKISLAVGGTAAANEVLRLSGSTVSLMKTAAAHLLWNTDASGDVGASGANRPNNLFLANNATIGAQLLASDGTVALPSMAFSADPDKGWYRDASARMALSYDGVRHSYQHISGGIPLFTFDSPVNSRGQIQIADNSAALYLVASASSGTGAEFRLHGSTHLSFASVTQFVTNNVVSGSISSTSVWTLGAANSVASHLVNGEKLILQNTGAGGGATDAFFHAKNTNTGSDAHAGLIVEAEGTGGDSYIQFDFTNAATDWSIGMKRTTGNYHVSNSTVLGTNDYFLATTAGKLVLGLVGGTQVHELNGSLSIFGANNLLWNTDGGGNIGAPGVNRPDKIYAKSQIILGSFTLDPTELGYIDDAEGLTSVTLVDNTASNTLVAAWAHASFSSIRVEYSLSRGAGIRETGTILIATDGITATHSRVGAPLGSNGVTFDVDISGANVRLLYTTTSTGTNATMKYKILKWLA